jgi:hypothetical protein
VAFCRTGWNPRTRLTAVATIAADDELSALSSFQVAALSNEAQEGLADGDTSDNSDHRRRIERLIDRRVERLGDGHGTGLYSHRYRH